MPLPRTLPLFVAAALSLACQGVVETPASPWRPESTTPDMEEVRRLCEGAPADVGETPLRRLSREQYENVVHDLTGRGLTDAQRARLAAIPDGREGGFTSTTLSVDAESARGYLTLAEELAPPILASEPAWADCAAAERECAQALVARFGRRAFRRPLADDEADDYLAMFDSLRESLDAPSAAETVLTAMLASPAFLYHHERVDLTRAEGGVAPLDGFSVASRLSFFLWRTAPDDSLLDRAAAGELDTADGVRGLAEEMLGDPRSDRTLDSFTAQWLEIEHLEDEGSPDEAWTPELAGAMREETLAFVRHVIRDGSGTLEELLTASYSHPPAAVAALYDAETDGEGRAALDPAVRSGLLTQASFLSRFGTIYPEIHRGRWIRGNLLCDPPMPPPPNVPDADAAERLRTAPCEGCHTLMDPIGFGFDAYDPMGRFVADAPAPLQPPEVRDPYGKLETSVAGLFSGPRELSERLAQSEQTHRCVATQIVRYAIGRGEATEDACELIAVGDRFVERGGDLRDLLISLTTSHSFRSRATREFE